MKEPWLVGRYGRGRGVGKENTFKSYLYGCWISPTEIFMAVGSLCLCMAKTNVWPLPSTNKEDKAHDNVCTTNSNNLQWHYLKKRN